MALQRIRIHSGDANEQVYLRPTDADRLRRQLQIRCHGPEHHPPELVTLLELIFSLSSLCQPDRCLHIHLLSVFNLLLSIHLPRITRTILILIQIC
jgi:hypothetical protein